MTGKSKFTRSKVYEIHFTISGAGEFPHDMLRYDTCYPYTAVDAGQMAGTERRTINMVSRSITAHVPTEGRWESFGWRVSNVRIM